MKRRLVLIAITLVGVLRISAPAVSAEPSLVPVILHNKDARVVNAKIVGPVLKSAILDGGADLLMFLPAGKYKCFYQFKEFDDASTPSPEGFLYSKTPEFDLAQNEGSPFTITAYPFEVVWPVPDLQDRAKPTTAREFNEAVRASTVVDATAIDAELDKLRFGEIDVIAEIGELYEAESKRANASVSASVRIYLNRYITQHLVPKLRQQKFTVNYLGFKKIPDTFTKPTLVLTYSESQGDAFTFNYQETVYGVDVECALSLYRPQLPLKPTFTSTAFPQWMAWTPVWRAKLRNGTVEGVRANILTNPINAFRRDALANLRYSFEDVVVKLDDWKPK
jgi:hypothetical protein